jgi:SAM-dependent methyltransferase
MTLRIPDDEVLRPSSPPEATPSSPAVSAAAEPPVEVPQTKRSSSAPPAAPAVVAPVAPDSSPVTVDDTLSVPPPDPPTIQLPPAPDTVADVGDLARTARLPAGDTLRGLPAVSPALAQSIVVLAGKPADRYVGVEPAPPPVPPRRPTLETVVEQSEVAPESADLAVQEKPASKPAKPPPPDLPPRAPRQSSIDIPVDMDDETVDARGEATGPESVAPLDIDLVKITSRPAPPMGGSPPVLVPPSPPAPRVEAAAAPPPVPVPQGDAPKPPPSPPPAPPSPLAAPKVPETPAWLAAARPPALAILAADEQPVSSSRPSEPGDTHEVSPEDVVSVESVRATALRRQLAGPGAQPQGGPSSSAQTPGTLAPGSGAQPTSVPRAPPPSSSGPALAASMPPLPPVAGARPPPPAVIAPVAPAAPAPSPLAPPPMNDVAAAARRRVRPWWEELFNDDFIRTMAKITDSQIGAEADFIEDSLGVAKGAMVLDLACGTGRHAIELTRRGYQVVGFDLSLAMLARAADEAQERDQKLNFVQGDMREMTFEDTFDGVYCWNTSFGFFEEEKNAQIVTNVRRALKTGGQFLLDVINRDFLARQAPSVAWFEGEGCVCMDEMNLDWITSRMRVKRTMMMDDGRTKETEYSIRVYSLHELGKLLHDSGFRVADVSGRTATPGVFLGADSPRTLILAEKR